MQMQGLSRALIIMLSLSLGVAKASAAAVYDFTAEPVSQTAHLFWTGDLGYSVRATFTFDPAHATATGTPTECLGLLELSLQVFDPGGTMIDESIDVHESIPFYPYLEFSFDTAQVRFTPGSFLDIGSDPGYWLQVHFTASVSFELWGRTPEIDPDGSEALVDSGGHYELFVIPEPAAGALALAFGIGWYLSRKGGTSLRGP